MTSNADMRLMGEAEMLRGLALLGKPPILSSEDEAHFNAIFWMVVDCVKAQNIIELMYLWHFVCASWIIKRYIRHGAVAIERRHLAQREFLARRAKLRQARKEDEVSREVEKIVRTPSDLAQLVRLGDNVVDMVTDTDEILENAATEREDNKALQLTIAFQEQLNTLIISQTAIRNDALRQLELFRMGLGRQAQEVTGRILEGECAEIEALPAPADAPSISPAQDQTCGQET